MYTGCLHVRRDGNRLRPYHALLGIAVAAFAYARKIRMEERVLSRRVWRTLTNRIKQRTSAHSSVGVLRARLSVARGRCATRLGTERFPRPSLLDGVPRPCQTRIPLGDRRTCSGRNLCRQRNLRKQPFDSATGSSGQPARASSRTISGAAIDGLFGVSLQAVPPGWRPAVNERRGRSASGPHTASVSLRGRPRELSGDRSALLATGLTLSAPGATACPRANGAGRLLVVAGGIDHETLVIAPDRLTQIGGNFRVRSVPQTAS